MFFPVYKGKRDRTGLERRKRKTPKVAGVRAPRLFCVGGERFGFFRCEAAGADETEQKHLLRIFAAVTLKKNFREDFCEVEDTKPKRTTDYHEASGGVSPSPQRGTNGAYITRVARPSGRCISSLNFRERKKHIVKPRYKVTRRSLGKRRASYLFLSFLKIN